MHVQMHTLICLLTNFYRHPISNQMHHHTHTNTQTLPLSDNDPLINNTTCSFAPLWPIVDPTIRAIATPNTGLRALALAGLVATAVIVRTWWVDACTSKTLKLSSGVLTVSAYACACRASVHVRAIE